MVRVSAVQSVLEALKTEIQTQYQPGDYLPNERLFAERFGVGRNTVREALIVLEAYGYVEKTQRGPRVCTPDIAVAFNVFAQYFDRSLNTCKDLLEFRRFIELGILPSVVINISDADIDKLEDLVRRMERALTARQAAEADYAFHHLMVEASGNAVIRKLYRVLAQSIVFYMEIGKHVPRHDIASADNHLLIVDALRRRSYPDLLAACTDHYRYSEGVLEETMNRDMALPVTTEPAQ